MPLLSASLDAFIFTSFVSVALWCYFTLYKSKYANVKPHLYITLFLALHTIYILHNLFLNTPQNIFQTLHLPLNVPSDRIRSKLLDLARVDVLPAHLDELISRLSSFDARMLYVRFGHDVFSCHYCRSYDDFALYALPRPALEYIREAAMLGFVTIRQSNHERWRLYSVLLLVAFFIGEMYYLNTVRISIKPPLQTKIFWHDTLWKARQVFFLLLPLAVHLLPHSHRKIPPLVMLPSVLQRIERSIGMLHGYQYLRGASARVAELNQNSTEWWAREKREGSWGVNDARVNDMAIRLGLDAVKDGVHDNEVVSSGSSHDSGQFVKSEKQLKPALRVTARKAAEDLMKGFADQKISG